MFNISRSFILLLLVAGSLWAQNPNSACFPAAVCTDSNLFVANNRPAVQKTLNGTITNGATTIVLSSGTGWLAPVIITVESEIIYCSTLTTNTLTGCNRGQEGTAATSHTTGVNVYNYLTEGYTNQLAAEIKAIEAALAARTLNAGTGGGTAQAQTATLVPVLTALANGADVCYKPSVSNTGAAPTLAVNGLTATTVTYRGGTAIAANDIIINVIACVKYNSTGPRWELQNPQTSGGGGGGSISFTGDGTLITNSASSSPVTVTLGTAGAHKWWGNPTGSTGAPGYNSLVLADLPTLFTLTTTGSSGAATYSGGILNIPQYTGGGGGSVFFGSTATAPTFSATPTFNLADISVKSPVRIEPAVLTANVTSVTFTNATAGAKFSIAWKQAASGSPFTVTYGASVGGTSACQIDQTVASPSVITTQMFEVGADGSTINGVGCRTSSNAFIMPEQAAPATPASGLGSWWFDSTNHIFTAMENNSATKSNTVVPITCSSQFISSIPITGVAACAGVTAAEVASGALANGMAATTQAADDNSTNIATTAYVDRMKARGLSFTLGDPTNSSALTTSFTTYFTVPFACTISAYNLLIDAADVTLRVKFWKIATGTAIPTVTQSISTSGLGVPSGTAVHSTTLTDFTTTTVSANDIMAMNVSNANTAKFINGVLECDQ